MRDRRNQVKDMLMNGRRPSFALGIAGCLALFVAGCVPSDASDETQSMRDAVKAASDGDGGMPAGAIPMSDGVYAVPVAVDAEGCETFTEWSSLGVARQAVYFRDGDGGFTTTRSERACSANMVEIGEDTRGCKTFRARQPNGEETDIVYYRAESGYTADPESAVCEG